MALTTITITETEDGEITCHVEGDNRYSNIFGLIEHAKMQFFCDYNDRYFENGAETPEQQNEYRSIRDRRRRRKENND